MYGIQQICICSLRLEWCWCWYAFFIFLPAFVVCFPVCDWWLGTSKLLNLLRHHWAESCQASTVMYIDSGLFTVYAPGVPSGIVFRLVRFSCTPNLSPHQVLNAPRTVVPQFGSEFHHVLARIFEAKAFFLKRKLFGLGKARVFITWPFVLEDSHSNFKNFQTFCFRTTWTPISFPFRIKFRLQILHQAKKVRWPWVPLMAPL